MTMSENHSLKTKKKEKATIMGITAGILVVLIIAFFGLGFFSALLSNKVLLTFGIIFLLMIFAIKVAK